MNTTTHNYQAPKDGSFTQEIKSSSSVESIAYASLTKRFTIHFRNGNTYDYEGVSQKDADIARKSDKMGNLSRNELKAYTGVKR